jgi:hypothetical protein
MAKQVSLFPFTGRLGNVIGYCRHGDYFLRTMPEKVRQTAGTRRAAQRFGIASRNAALIRKAIIGELDIAFDSSYINQLNKTLIQAGGRVSAALKGFRFNTHTGIERFFTIAPALSGSDTLHIPPQTVSQYPGITALEVTVIATRISFGTQRIISTDTVQVRIDPMKPFTGTDITLNAPGEGTLLLTLQVKGLFNGLPSSNKKYLAADIIAVVEPQKQQVGYKPVRRLQTIPRRRTVVSHSQSGAFVAHAFIQRE